MLWYFSLKTGKAFVGIGCKYNYLLSSNRTFKTSSVYRVKIQDQTLWMSLWKIQNCKFHILLPKENRNKSSYSQYLPLFWPFWQSRAAAEPHLSLSQNAHLQTIGFGRPLLMYHCSKSLSRVFTYKNYENGKTTLFLFMKNNSHFQIYVLTFCN